MGKENIQKKISKAKNILREGSGFFSANLENIFHEFAELNIGHSKEIWPLLRKLLREVRPEHYIKPEVASTNPELEFFIFSWMSKSLNRFVTLKFALNGEYFFYISLR
jgi:hypothetical protein